MAQIVVIVGGVQRPVTRVRAMVGGVLRDITKAVAIVGGAQRVVYQPGTTPTPPPSQYTATASPGGVQGSSNSTGGRPIYTDTCAVSVSGGTGPYTYAWIKRSDDGLATWSPANSTASSTNFKATGLAPGETSEAAFYCVVTDANKQSTTSNDVHTSAYNTNGTGTQ